MATMLQLKTFEQFIFALFALKMIAMRNLGMMNYSSPFSLSYTQHIIGNQLLNLNLQCMRAILDWENFNLGERNQ